jgi:integrase
MGGLLERQLSASIQPSDIREWLGAMAVEELSASRRRKCLIVLSLMLDSAVRDRLILHNAAKDVKSPRIERREAAYFEPATVEPIANAMSREQYRLLVLVLGRLGLRFGEAPRSSAAASMCCAAG